jgi:hypothetical protein
MTLQAALSTAIELLRTQGLPEHLKAAKVLEKKHERLRLKQETRRRTSRISASES